MEIASSRSLGGKALFLVIGLFSLLLFRTACPSPNPFGHGHGGHHPNPNHHHHHHGDAQNEHENGGAGHHAHGQQQHPMMNARSPQHHQPRPAGCPCSSAGAEGQSMSNCHHRHQQMGGMPLLLFPDHAQKAVDVVLGADSAFYRDNDELAHRVFDLLAQRFPRHLFLVAVGNVPPGSLAADNEEAKPGVRFLNGRKGPMTLQGTARVGPNHNPFAFMDAQHYPRDNNQTRLWYVVHAVEADQLSNKEGSSPTNCVSDEIGSRGCLPSDLQTKCQLGLALLVPWNSDPAVYTSQPFATNPKLMRVLNSVQECAGANGGEQQQDDDNDDGDGGKVYAILLAENMDKDKRQEGKEMNKNKKNKGTEEGEEDSEEQH